MECSPHSCTLLLSGNESGTSWPDTENPSSSWYTHLPCTCNFFGGSTAAACPVLCNPFAPGALTLLHSHWRSGASKAPLMGTHAQHREPLQIYTLWERLGPIPTHQHLQVAQYESPRAAAVSSRSCRTGLRVMAKPAQQTPPTSC